MIDIALNQYKTLVFDCDGVVLNSNKIKTQAFYEATKHYGHEAAQALVDYHICNGGISRYSKFEYFFNEILKQEIEAKVFDNILLHFAQIVKEQLVRCEVAEGLDQLRIYTKSAKWLIVSGGDQTELREIFLIRGIETYFDGGIFGSPDNKAEILQREVAKGNIIAPALFIGDSKYDYKVAKVAGLDFAFVSNWTEVEDFAEFIADENIHAFVSLSSIK